MRKEKQKGDMPGSDHLTRIGKKKETEKLHGEGAKIKGNKN